jgi:hypothetical protein
VIDTPGVLLELTVVTPCGFGGKPPSAMAAKARRNAKKTFMMEAPEIERATSKELKSRPPSTGIEGTMEEQVRSSSTSSKGREREDEFVRKETCLERKRRGRRNPKSILNTKYQSES